MLKVVGEHLTMDLNKPLAAPKKDWICEPVRFNMQIEQMCSESTSYC